MNHMRIGFWSWRVILLAVSFGVILVACGGGSDNAGKAPAAGQTRSPEPSDVHPCDQLTAAEIGAAIGKTPAEGKKDASSFPGPDCTWDLGGGLGVMLSTAPIGSLSAQGWVDANRRTFERQDQSSLAPSQRTTFIVVSDLGDAAWAEESANGKIQQIHAASGKITLGLTFVYQGGPASKEAATDLMKKAVARL